MKQTTETFVTMAIVTATLIIVSGLSSGVNSFSSTGHPDEEDHGRFKDAAKEAKDELNDYYNGQGQIHRADTDGTDTGKLMMDIQRMQPQHYIQCSHSATNGNTKGKNIWSGDSDTGGEEYIPATKWMEHIKAGKNGFYHSALPLGVVVTLGCKSGYYEDGGTDFNKNAFLNHMHSWVYCGVRNSPTVEAGKKFVYCYTDDVTDDADSYQNGIEEATRDADNVHDNHAFKTRTWCWSGGPLDHDTWKDKYRKIDRKESCEGLQYGREDPIRLTYERDFSGTTNGAYYIFHGFINGDEQDLEDSANINIKIEKNTEGTSNWEVIYNEDFNNLQNQFSDEGGIAGYGGSQVCSVYISPADIRNSNIQVTTTLKGDSEAGSIKVNRNEIMEIGK